MRHPYDIATAEDIERAIDRARALAVVDRAASSISPRNSRILAEWANGGTLREIAEVHGVGAERVRQIIVSEVGRLRAEVRRSLRAPWEVRNIAHRLRYRHVEKLRREAEARAITATLRALQASIVALEKRIGGLPKSAHALRATLRAEIEKHRAMLLIESARKDRL